MADKVVVLGASGFVGRAVVERLAAQGMEVLAASRSGAAVPGGQAQVLDATVAAGVAAATADAVAVVNCVAAPPAAMVRGAEVLRDVLAARAGAVRLVHFSSMAAYGSVMGNVAEDAPLRGDLGLYSAAKARCEAVLRDLPAATTVVLRPGCIYGPGSTQWSERIARLLHAGRIGDLGPAGDGCSNLVHVADVADAVAASLRLPAKGGLRAFNLAMRDAPRWNDYLVAYGIALDAVPVNRIPQRRLRIEGRLLAPLLKVAEKAGRPLGVRHTPPALTPSMLALWRQQIRLLPDAAEAQLGLRWTSLAHGIRQTAELYRVPAR